MSGGKSSAAILAEAARLLRCRVVGRREFDGNANERPFGTACAECYCCGSGPGVLVSGGLAFERTAGGLAWPCPGCGKTVHEAVDDPHMGDAARIVADPLCVNCRKNGRAAPLGYESRPLAVATDWEAP